MKILFITDSLQSGGKERRLTELLKSLVDTPNITFELIIMNKDIHYTDVLQLNIKIHYLIRNSKKDISIFTKLDAICRIFKPDIIHSWDSMSSIYISPIAFFRQIKFVNGMIADAPNRNRYLNKHWIRAKISFLFSDAIIGNSAAGLLAYGAPRKKSYCINNGFNFNRLRILQSKEDIKSELRIDNNKIIIGMVATFSPYKDYRTYFEAAEILLQKQDNLIFLSIGKNTDSEEAYNLIPKKYSKHFIQLGKQSMIESYINIMNICVLATFTEGISNSIMEYMALKKPVIATIGGGTNELVIDNITGFLVKPKNPEELANQIELLLKNPILQKNMGNQGYLRIENYFSIKKMVADTIEIYKKVLK